MVHRGTYHVAWLRSTLCRAATLHHLLNNSQPFEQGCRCVYWAAALQQAGAQCSTPQRLKRAPLLQFLASERWAWQSLKRAWTRAAAASLQSIRTLRRRRLQKTGAQLISSTRRCSPAHAQTSTCEALCACSAIARVAANVSKLFGAICMASRVVSVHNFSCTSCANDWAQLHPDNMCRTMGTHPSSRCSSRSRQMAMALTTRLSALDPWA